MKTYRITKGEYAGKVIAVADFEQLRPYLELCNLIVSDRIRINDVALYPQDIDVIPTIEELIQ